MTEPTTNEEETVDAVETDEDAAPDAGSGGSPEASEGAETPSDPDASEEGRDHEPRTRGSKTSAEDSAVGAGGGDGPTAAADETQLVALREEFEALNDRHLRLAAEFNNFRRRSEQERLSAWARAQADLVADLLDVLDDLHRVAELDLTNATVETIMEGIDLVERKFMRKLEEAGVEVIEPRGEAFDPERMEAMMRVPAQDDDEVDSVAEVFQKGYSLKGILVRPARVSVYTQG